MSERVEGLAEVMQLQPVQAPQFDGSLALEREFDTPALYLVPSFEESSAPEQPLFQSADFIPELAFVRERTRREAQATMRERQQQLDSGNAEAVPLAVDALGTAVLVVEAEKDHGLESEQRRSRFDGLVLDCERLLGEAYRANTWEYFAESEQNYDDATEDFYSNGISLGQLNENGLTPSGVAEEDARRINEVVEEKGTYRPLGKMLMSKTVELEVVPESVNVATISQCTDAAIEDYVAGKKTGFGGYVPTIEKIMIRNVRFAPQEGSRYQEQVGANGTLLKPIINLGLTILDARLASQMDKTTVHGTQIVTEAEVGAMDYMELFDLLASDYHGFDIFMGERLPEGEVRDYEAVKIEAQQRQEQLHEKAVWLANRAVELERKGIKHRVANAIIEAEVRELALQDCREQPELARVIFDEKTHQGFLDVRLLEAQGQFEMAETRRVEVEANAPAVQFCGAGMCGLEKVSELSREAVKTRGLGLKGESLLHDKERACPSCRKLTVHYDKFANKVCSNEKCHFRKINGKVSGGEKHD